MIKLKFIKLMHCLYLAYLVAIEAKLELKISVLSPTLFFVQAPCYHRQENFLHHTHTMY